MNKNYIFFTILNKILSLSWNSRLDYGGNNAMVMDPIPNPNMCKNC